MVFSGGPPTNGGPAFYLNPEGSPCFGVRTLVRGAGGVLRWTEAQLPALSAELLAKRVPQAPGFWREVIQVPFRSATQQLLGQRPPTVTFPLPNLNLGGWQPQNLNFAVSVAESLLHRRGGAEGALLEAALEQAGGITLDPLAGVLVGVVAVALANYDFRRLPFPLSNRASEPTADPAAVPKADPALEALFEATLNGTPEEHQEALRNFPDQPETVSGGAGSAPANGADRLPSGEATPADPAEVPLQGPLDAPLQGPLDAPLAVTTGATPEVTAETPPAPTATASVGFHGDNPGDGSRDSRDNRSGDASPERPVQTPNPTEVRWGELRQTIAEKRLLPPNMSVAGLLQVVPDGPGGLEEAVGSLPGGSMAAALRSCGGGAPSPAGGGRWGIGPAAAVLAAAALRRVRCRPLAAAEAAGGGAGIGGPYAGALH